MVDADGRADEQARLDALRRRLYRADVTEEDRRRHAELRERLAGAAALAPADEPVEAEAPPPAPRLRLRIVVPAAALVLAAGLGLALLPRPGAPVALDTGPVVQDLGSASTARNAVRTAPRPVAPTPTPLAVLVDGVPTAAQRFHGRGGTTVPIDSSSAPRHGGSFVVVLDAEGPSPISWQAVRPATAENQASFEQVIAMSDPAPRQGLASSSSSTYDDDPPTSIVVLETGTSPWTLTVAFTGDSAPQLR